MASKNQRGKFFSFRLEGARELEKVLEELPKAVAKQVLMKAGKAALKPVLDEARANAKTQVKRRTGRFADSFNISTKLTKRQTRLARRYGEKMGVDLYVGSTDQKAHLIEFGTSSLSARPVLRPAWDAYKQVVLDIFTLKIAEELKTAARRLASKALRGKLSAKEKAALK